MNSFSGVVRALEVEFARQCAVLDGGGTIEQQTMLWDENAGEVRPARSKEGSHDYRYFPEPDLPPLILALERIDRDQASAARAAGRAPRAISSSEHSTSLTDYDIEVLTCESPRWAITSSRSRAQSGDAKTAANWMMGEVLATLKATGQTIEHFTVRPADLGALLDMVRDGVVSHSAAKQIFARDGEDRRSAGADRRARGPAQGERRRSAGRAGSTKCSPSIPAKRRASSAARSGCRACSSAT